MEVFEGKFTNNNGLSRITLLLFHAQSFSLDFWFQQFLLALRSFSICTDVDREFCFFLSKKNHFLSTWLVWFLFCMFASSRTSFSTGTNSKGFLIFWSARWNAKQLRIICFRLQTLIAYVLLFLQFCFRCASSVLYRCCRIFVRSQSQCPFAWKKLVRFCMLYPRKLHKLNFHEPEKNFHRYENLSWLSWWPSG